MAPDFSVKTFVQITSFYDAKYLSPEKFLPFWDYHHEMFFVNIKWPLILLMPIILSK